MKRHPPHRPLGVSLIETVLATAVVAIAGVAVLNIVGVSGGVGLHARDRALGEALARDLAAEISAARFSEGVAFGPDAGEDDGSRVGFDDIDDFAGWASSPPQMADGTPITDFSGWTRSAKVVYVDPTNPLIESADPTTAKRVTVIVERGPRQAARIVLVRTAGLDFASQD